MGRIFKVQWLQSDISISAVEDLVAALCSPKVHRLHLPTTPLQTQSPLPAPNRNSFAVWRAATTGCAVDAGTLELPEGGVLLLAGRGVHFHGTTFTGGVVMCAGPQFSGTFQNCTFRSTAVYAVHGAAVTLRDCTFLHAHLGLTLSGEATSATLTACTFRGCRDSIVVEAGAAVALSSCLILETECAITVNEDGSHAALENCDARGGVLDEHASGVAVRRGTATLRTCTLENFYTAVYADGGTVELRGVHIVGSVQGVFMRHRARALVRECDVRMTIHGPQGAEGCTAFGTAGDEGRVCMQLERCAVRDCVAAARALAVDDGSSVAATLCRFSCCTNVAAIGTGGGGGRAMLSHCAGDSSKLCISVTSPTARLRLKGGRYDGSTCVCAARQGAQLTAADCEFHACDSPWEHAGVDTDAGEFPGVDVVEGGAQARLHGCSVQGGATGVLAWDADVSAVNTRICDVQTTLAPVPGSTWGGDDKFGDKGGAAFMCVGSRLTVRGGSVRRCVVGIEAEHRPSYPSSVTVDRVEFTDCASGVDCAHAGRADVAHCVFRGLQGERGGAPGLAVLREAAERRHRGRGAAGISFHCLQASVEHCSVSGFAAGVVVALADAEVSVRHCDITLPAAGVRGVGAVVNGNVAIEDCKFHSFGSTDARSVAVAGSATCAVRRCSFQGASLSVIDAYGEASVTVVDSTLAGPCSHGLGVHDRAQIAAQDCRITDAEFAVDVPARGGVFTAKRVKMQASIANVNVPPAPRHRGRRTVVKVVDSELRDAGTGVWAADAVADVAILRCSITAADTGVSIAGPVQARIKGGSISGGDTGVIIGAVVDAGPAPCVVCGLQGQAAIQAGAMAATASRSGVKPAHCTHEGAVVRMTMADCEVARCSTGVHAHLLGRLAASGVTARDCGRGFWMYLYAGFCSFERCRAIGCRLGAGEMDQRALVSMDDMHEDPVSATRIPGVEVVPI